MASVCMQQHTALERLVLGSRQPLAGLDTACPIVHHEGFSGGGAVRRGAVEASSGGVALVASEGLCEWREEGVNGMRSGELCDLWTMQ